MADDYDLEKGKRLQQTFMILPILFKIFRCVVIPIIIIFIIYKALPDSILESIFGTK